MVRKWTFINQNKTQLKSKEKKRIWIYIRASTQNQADEGYGLESQQRILKSFIASNEEFWWEYNEKLIYVDWWISWALEVSERPGLSRLKEDILDSKIDVVLVWKIDRLFRKTSSLLEFIEFLKERGINFVSKTENIDLSSHTWKLVLTLLWAIAEMEREVISERTSEGKISKALQGYFVYWKNVPFWYCLENDWKWNKLTVLENDADIVKRIFEMFVVEWKTSWYIAKYLSETSFSDLSKINSESRIKWVWRRTKMWQTFIVKLLRNESYIWKYYCNKTRTQKVNWEYISYYKDKSEWILINCSKIIDEGLFFKAQDLLDKWQVINWKWERHLLTWLVKCWECWKTYNYYRSRKDTWNYRCWGKKRDKILNWMYCKNIDISENKLLADVWSKIDLFLKNPKELLKIYEEMNNSWENKTKITAYMKELLVLNGYIIKNNNSLKEIYRKEIETEDITKTKIYTDIWNDLLREIQTFEKRKIELEDMIKDYESVEDTRKSIIELSRVYKENYWKIDEKEKQKYIDNFVDIITVFPDKNRVRYKFERV